MKFKKSSNAEYLYSGALQAAVVTALAFLLATLIVQPLSFSAMSVFSAPEKNDFSITDLYAQVADRRPVSVLDSNLVLVDIGAAKRAEIAEILETVALCGPRAVGVDVFFGEPQEGDEALLNAIAGLPGAVLPVGLSQAGRDGGTQMEFTLSDAPFFYGEPLPVTYAGANLPGAFEGATIREFATGFKLADGTVMPSFPMAVAAAASPSAVKQVADRGHHLELIDYPSRRYLSIPAEELHARGEALTGKVVLVGAMSDAYDMHSTPVNSYMSGLSIHAAAVSTILDGACYDRPGSFPDWLPACILCFIMLLMREFTGTALRGLLVRCLQLLIVYLAVRIGYSLYVDHHIIFDFSYTMLMMMFGLFAADIWAGLRYMGPRVYAYIENLITRLVAVWNA